MGFKVQTNNEPSLATRRRLNKAKREREEQHDRNYRSLDGRAFFTEEELEQMAERKDDERERYIAMLETLEKIKRTNRFIYKKTIKKHGPRLSALRKKYGFGI